MARKWAETCRQLKKPNTFVLCVDRVVFQCDKLICLVVFLDALSIRAANGKVMS
jgi:hypothetical protein